MPNEIQVYCAHKKLVKLSQLKPHPGNPNKHPPEQIALLAKVIAVQGWRNPIIVSNRSGLITKGHARREAALSLKCATVPVDYQDYATESEELADMIADNRVAELAEADRSMLRELAEQLDDGAFDMDLTGFDHDALEELMTAAPPDSGIDAEPQIDKAEELRVKWGVERGQIWELGEHRIMCGDSTQRGQVDSLMNGEVRCVFTDPPYGVSYEAKNQFLNAISRGNSIQKPIESDQKTAKGVEELVTESLTVACENVRPGSVLYMTCPPGTSLHHFIIAINAAGFTYKHGLVWVKNQFVLGRCDYHYRHEMVLYGWKENGAHYFTKERGLDSVFSIDKPRISNLHPTTKPTELVAQCIGNSTKPGWATYDPFSGSGTTIIACEQLGRKCRAMEIDPGYVAVSIQRWADATGKTPRLLNGK